MRLIGTLGHSNEAERFLSYLERAGIPARCEANFHPETNRAQYQMWVLDEDQLIKAEEEFGRFVSEPTSAKYDPPAAQMIAEQAAVEPPRAWVTNILLALCVFCFLLSVWQDYMSHEANPNSPPFLAPVQLALMYDAPATSAEALVTGHFWKGAYSWVMLQMTHSDPALAEGPFMVKIRSGEIWRLATPILLHGELLHLLFNMLWLVVLGKQVEARIGALRTLALTLLIAVGSNTLQYLVSGPFFFGYSGVVMGLAGFIWMRQRLAPWEGYPMHRSTFLFLTIFVLGMLVLQCLSVVLLLTVGYNMPIYIANTAHIGGGLYGLLLAKWPWLGTARR
ncbi:MAG: hypothetical protein RL235_287 [Chlamydiota bacterium]|jgi:GlpG protein